MISFYRILATTRLTVEPGDFREIGERHDDCHSQISQNPKFGQIWLTSTKSGGTPLSMKSSQMKLFLHFTNDNIVKSPIFMLESAYWMNIVENKNDFCFLIWLFLFFKILK